MQILGFLLRGDTNQGSHSIWSALELLVPGFAQGESPVCSLQCRLSPSGAEAKRLPQRIRKRSPCPDFHSSALLFITSYPFQPVWRKGTPRVDGRARREQLKEHGSDSSSSAPLPEFSWCKAKCEQGIYDGSKAVCWWNSTTSDCSGTCLSSYQSKRPLSTGESGPMFALSPYFFLYPTTNYRPVVLKDMRRSQALYCLPNKC